VSPEAPHGAGGAPEEPVRRRLGGLGLAAIEGIERTSRLDGLAGRLAGMERGLDASARVRDALRGTWLGHGVHPLLTDFAEGCWMSAVFLDLVGPPGSERPAQRLLGLSLLFSVPAHLTGLSELGAVSTPGERRLGTVHGIAVSAATALFAVSYGLRRRSRHRAGEAVGLAAGILALADGYVGGHLSHGRGVAVGETGRR
jgi:hypothetical protein